MKILFITPWFPSNRQDQIGNFILDSVEALAHMGHEIVVLVSRSWKPKSACIISKFWINKDINIENLADNIHIHICQYFSIPRYVLSTISNWSFRKHVGHIAEKLVIQYQCQLIHAHTELASVVAVDIGKKHGIPSVVTLHGISTAKKLYLNNKKLLFGYGLENISRVVLVGDPLGVFFKKLVSHHEHFRVVQNGFRAHHSKLVVKRKDTQHIRLISVSHLHEGKGIDINLHALAKLNESGVKQWTYKIIGEGYEKKKLEKLARKLYLDDQVKFIGACKHDEVYTHLSVADVFILPSYREAFGVAYLEAMSFGLLVIGVEGQGPASFIENGKTGFLVKGRSIDSLLDTLKAIFRSLQKVLLIANTGKEYVHNNFTWYKHAEKLTNIYHELIKIYCQD
ncbi:MAG TPA: glycosyltransferase family 4 protein [Gammaproteobacteria bacterium]|nr:glycosyltransferase family 4 protein [Gammaproteobacteria bacterium]